jgi:hypothetical protein
VHTHKSHTVNHDIRNRRPTAYCWQKDDEIGRSSSYVAAASSSSVPNKSDGSSRGSSSAKAKNDPSSNHRIAPQPLEIGPLSQNK